MTTPVLALWGAVIGVGLLQIRRTWRSFKGVPVTPPHSVSRVTWRPGRTAWRPGLAVSMALAVVTATGWPVLGISAALAGWWLPTAWAARGRAQREQAVVEAVATWAEQLRDTMSAASGLEHAVTATARLAHGPLAPSLTRLAQRLDHEPLTTAVRGFADEVRHPSADFVAAALITATEHEARDIATLLGHLAASARDEARLRRRVWVGRARTRSASRLIAGVVVAVVAGLQLLNPAYLDPYADATGQMVLAGILGVFTGAFVAMERLSRFGLPERFALRSPARSTAGRGSS